MPRSKPLSRATRVHRRSAALVIVALALALAACGSDGGGDAAPASDGPDVVRVPADAATIAAAVDLVAENGLVLVAPGTYAEEVVISTPGVTLRGLDRNEVVIDGEGERSNGIVASAPNVTIENLTVRRFLFNGILVTGVVDDAGEAQGRASDGYEPTPDDMPLVPGFAVRYVTAANNGLYGIYAFNRSDGVIEHSHASGGADSGIYVGQCEDCRILVQGNVATGNAVGYESANASGVIVTGNRFADNRVGASLQTELRERYEPHRRSIFVGNVVADNDAEDTPEQARGAFGIGVGLAGTDGVEVLRNLVSGHPTTAVMLSPAFNVSAVDNRVAGNRFADNRIDVTVWSSAEAGTRPNCVEVAAGDRVDPDPLPAGQRCEGTDGVLLAPWRQPVPSPKGIPFLDVAAPGPLPTMPGDPATLPHGPAVGVDLPDPDDIEVPEASLLIEATGP